MKMPVNISFPGLDMAEIKILASPELWEQEPEKALILALRRSGKFDCQDYLSRYPDVKEQGMAPDEHYVIYGRKENRTCRILPTPPVLDFSAPSKPDKLTELKREIDILKSENAMLLEQLQLAREKLDECNGKA